MRENKRGDCTERNSEFPRFRDMLVGQVLRARGMGMGMVRGLGTVHWTRRRSGGNERQLVHKKKKKGFNELTCNYPNNNSPYILEHVRTFTTNQPLLSTPKKDNNDEKPNNNNNNNHPPTKKPQPNKYKDLPFPKDLARTPAQKRM